MDYKKMWYELKKFLIEEDLGYIILQMNKQEVEEVLGVKEEQVGKVEDTVEDYKNRRLARDLEL